jgi:prepilin-type N-terminal cleavage/methylation domain-containing protein
MPKFFARAQAGFTLIELLVVIAILGVLMAAGTVMFVNAQATGRDGKRLQDLRGIQAAFEQYNVVNGTYAAAATMAVGNFPGDALPLDPKNATTPYTFTVAATNDQYCACARLERPVRYANATGQGATAGTCAFVSAAGTHFCIANRN